MPDFQHQRESRKHEASLRRSGNVSIAKGGPNAPIRLLLLTAGTERYARHPIPLNYLWDRQLQCVQIIGRSRFGTSIYFI